MNKEWASILERLDINDPECIYLQFSVQGTTINFPDIPKFLDFFCDYFGKNCTVFMPTYPFSVTSDYIKYIGQKEIIYDSILTPCRLNLVGEMFRRKKGTVRSLHPITPITGFGPLAHEILKDDYTSETLFDQNSSFNCFTKYNSYIVGIGLSSHTNTFIHLIDFFQLKKFPFPLYVETSAKAKLFENKKFIETRNYYCLLPEIRRSIKPEMMESSLKGKEFYKPISTPFPAYSMKLSSYLTHGNRMAEEAFLSNQVPAWHQS